jgi:hypothetical protein
MMRHATSGHEQGSNESYRNIPAPRMPHATSGQQQEFNIAPARMPNITSGHEQNKWLSYGFEPATMKKVHAGANCDNCQASPIRGVRYKCSSCVNYDLCENCMSLLEDEFPDNRPRVRHNETHIFYRIARPVVIQNEKRAVLLNRSGWIHHDIGCSSCRCRSIVGIRYMCTVCAVSLCEQCEQSGEHPVSHNLIKIAVPNTPSETSSNSNDNNDLGYVDFGRK